MFCLVIVNKMNYVGLKQGSICLLWSLSEKQFHIQSLERFIITFFLFSGITQMWKISKLLQQLILF